MGIKIGNSLDLWLDAVQQYDWLKNQKPKKKSPDWLQIHIDGRLKCKHNW